MPPFDLAVCAEMVFLDLPIAERVQRIAEAGFLVEIWDHTRHDVAALERTGARFSSMTGYVSGSLIDPEGAEDLLCTAAVCIDVAGRLGCPRLNLHTTGLDDKGLPKQPVYRATGTMFVTACRTLEKVAALGERHGVTFTLENLNTLVDHPGIPFSTAEDVLALVGAVNHSHLRVMLDLYHAQIGEGNLVELLRRALPFVGGIQVADVPGRCEPGTGEINYPAIAEELVRLGYEGVVGLEGWASEDSPEALERFRAAFSEARPGDGP